MANLATEFDQNFIGINLFKFCTTVSKSPNRVVNCFACIFNLSKPFPYVPTEKGEKKKKMSHIICV